jgi:hypothetical protein
MNPTRLAWLLVLAGQDTPPNTLAGPQLHPTICSSIIPLSSTAPSEEVTQ